MFEDRFLIRGFNAGDTQALRRIYEKYRSDLFRVAGALLHEPAAVEDVVHDVFVAFAAQAGRFELRGSLKGYLAICVANRTRKQSLAVFHLWKKYAKYPATDEQIALMERLAPAGMIDLLLQNDHRKLGPRVIDGVDVEGFELDSLESIQDILPKWLFDIQQGKATAWIATGELLPVRFEGDMRIGRSLATLFRDIRLQETATLESYDVELDPNLFDTNVPEGYDEFGLTDFIPGKLSLAGAGVLPAGVIVWRRSRGRRRNRVPV